MFIKCQIHTRFACYREGHVFISLWQSAQWLRSENVPGCASFRASPHDRLLTQGALRNSSDAVPADVSLAYSSPSPVIPSLVILKLHLRVLKYKLGKFGLEGVLFWFPQPTINIFSETEWNSMSGHQMWLLQRRLGREAVFSLLLAYLNTLQASQSPVKTLMWHLKSLPQGETHFLQPVPYRIFLSRCCN